MLLDELIEKLKVVREQEGNLDVFASDFTGAIVTVDINEDNGRFPRSWEMPARFVVIGNEPMHL